MNRFMNYVNYHVATGLGTGRSPIAPGTVGSLLGLLLVYLFLPGNGIFQLIMIGLLIFVAITSSDWLAEAESVKDPSFITVDEIAGQFVTFLWLPYRAWDSISVLIIGFLLFRAFDIWKPFPIRKLERLPGGLGIVLDDVLAGVYANILLQIWLRFF